MNHGKNSQEMEYHITKYRSAVFVIDLSPSVIQQNNLRFIQGAS